MNPVVIEDAISVAANSINDNVIVSNTSLRRYLRCPFYGKGRFAGVISATGLRVDVEYGSNNVIASSDLRVGTDLQIPLDLVNDDFFPGEGDQFVIRANNTTGGAITLRYRLEVYPLANPGEADPRGKFSHTDKRVMQRGPVSVANGTVDQQLLSGLKYERPSVPGILKVLMTASAAGLTKQLYVGMVNIAPPALIPPLNRVPQDPFDTLIENVEVPADKLIELPVSNSSGGALNAFFRAELNELMRQ